MTPDDLKAVRKASDFISSLVEKAQAGLSEEEKAQRRNAAAVGAKDAVARYERILKKELGQAASHGR